MKRMAIIFLGLTLISNLCWAADSLDLEDDKIRTSYSVGYQVGGDFIRQGMDINPEVLIKGVQDALSGTEPVMSAQEMRQTLVDLNKKVLALQKEKEMALAETNSAEGKAFLDENGKKDSIKTLPSGLQYEIIKGGTGAPPKVTDTVTVHYRGTLIDGTEFDSSYKRNAPATFRLDRVIKGWTEGLQLMQPGAKLLFFIPPDLAYGERGAGGTIGPNSTLIFEVELLAVEGS